MRTHTKLSLCVVAITAVATATVTLFSLREQTELLRAHGIRTEGVKNANRVTAKHGLYLASAIIISTSVIALVMSRRSADATGHADTVVLHDIGNAINSVAIGIGTIRENLISSRLARHISALARAVEEHRDDFSDYVEKDPQGREVVPFIIALADDFAERDRRLAGIADRVYERAAHIVDIIRELQRG